MTRLYTDGAEMNDMLFWDYATAITTGSASPAPTDGEWYYRFAALGTCYKNITATNEFYMRYRFYVPSGVDGRDVFPQISSGGQASFNIGFNTTTHQLLFTGYSFATITSNQVINGGQWYLIELYFKIADDPNGRVVIKVDGTTVIDFTGDTYLNGMATVNLIAFSSYALACLDDFAFNDTSGTFDNSWCGDGHVAKIYPSGSGTTNGWLNSGSTSGSSNYTYVDEFPSDGDTTYVYASGSNTGLQDQYKMTSFTGAGKTITRIFMQATARKTKADTTTVKIGYLPSGGTDQLSGSLSLASGSYVRITGTSGSWNPVTGVAWTTADVNALEAVVEI